MKTRPIARTLPHADGLTFDRKTNSHQRQVRSDGGRTGSLDGCSTRCRYSTWRNMCGICGWLVCPQFLEEFGRRGDVRKARGGGAPPGGQWPDARSLSETEVTRIGSDECADPRLAFEEPEAVRDAIEGPPAFARRRGRKNAQEAVQTGGLSLFECDAVRRARDCAHLDATRADGIEAHSDALVHKQALHPAARGYLRTELFATKPLFRRFNEDPESVAPRPRAVLIHERPGVDSLARRHRDGFFHGVAPGRPGIEEHAVQVENDRTGGGHAQTARPNFARAAW